MRPLSITNPNLSIVAYTADEVEYRWLEAEFNIDKVIKV